MKIALLSDSHDRLDFLQRVMVDVNQEGCQTVIHCGDLAAPFMLKELANSFAGPIHIVFGNNDGDRAALATKADNDYKNVSLHGEMGQIEVDGRKIFITHYPKYGQLAAASGEYDLVCYGHNHQNFFALVGKTALVNPGNLCGVGGQPSWAIYDTTDNSVVFKKYEL